MHPEVVVRDMAVKVYDIHTKMDALTVAFEVRMIAPTLSDLT